MVALTRTNSGTISLAESTTGWNGDTFSLEPDIKTQGSNSVACAQTNNGTNDLWVAGSWNFNGSQHIRLQWNCTYTGYFSTSNPVQVYLSDGSNTDYFNYFTTNTEYAGGWADLIVAVNSTNFPTVTLSSITQVGVRVNTSAKPRNVPANVWCDNWRYADGLEIYSSASEAVSLLDAATNDATNEYFILKYVDGVLFAPCEIILGSSGSNNANIVSENETIVFPDRNVTGSLYKLKTQEGTGNTDIDIAGLVCKTIGGSGAELDISSSLNSLSLVSSAFIDMGTITVTPTVTTPTFETTSFTNCGATSLSIEAVGCTWSTSGQITLSGSGKLTSCTIQNSSASIAVSGSLADIDDCTFISDGTGHAVNLGTISSSTTLNWQNTDSGYTASSSGNETILVNYTDTGSPLTINVAAGYSTPSVYNTGGGTVNVVSGQVTLTLTGLKTNSEVRFYSAGTQTELDGVENSGTTFGYTYTYAANTYVDIVIHNVSYQYLRLSNVLLGSADASLPVQQVYDRWYSNP